MPWFRIDDNFYDHPKVDDLPLSAVGLWTLAGTYCAKQLTDGQITASRIRKFGATNDDVTALLTAGLWEQCEDGYAFRNWDEYQPTRESVEGEREKNRKRAQKWREKKRDPDLTSDDITERNAVTQPHEHVTNAARTGAPTRPDPTRPEEEPSSATRKKPARKLPEDWTPTDTHQAKATEKGLNLNHEAENFRLHAETHDRKAANWNSAFTMWLNKATPRQPTIPMGRPTQGSWMTPRKAS